jgi:hypothetical protein
MRTKLLSSIVLATMALAGVASADPYVRDHRYQPAVTARASLSFQSNWNRPEIPSTTTYGYQISENGQWAQGYSYGNDPYVESTPRSSWITLAAQMRLNVSNSLDIPVNQRVGVLELQSQWANVTINRVLVRLNDGRTINVATNRLLDREHAPNLRIDLGAQAQCGVRDVIVFGSGGGTFRLIGA